MDFFAEKKTKKICNYVVVPNNFVLSLALSLALLG